MKAAMNGTLNLSILDGWWDEAYSTHIGWAIGRGEEYEDHALQDEVEGEALYDLLEREIIPLFYARGMDGLPREWIRRMKESMRDVGKRFSSHRMLLEYAGTFYSPAVANAQKLMHEELRALPGRRRRTWRSSATAGMRCGSRKSPPLPRGSFPSETRSRCRRASSWPTSHRKSWAWSCTTGRCRHREKSSTPRRLEMTPCGTRGNGGPVLRGGDLRPHRAAGFHGAHPAQAPGARASVPPRAGEVGLITALRAAPLAHNPSR